MKGMRHGWAASRATDTAVLSTNVGLSLVLIWIRTWRMSRSSADTWRRKLRSDICLVLIQCQHKVQNYSWMMLISRLVTNVSKVSRSAFTYLKVRYPSVRWSITWTPGPGWRLGVLLTPISELLNIYHRKRQQRLDRTIFPRQPTSPLTIQLKVAIPPVILQQQTGYQVTKGLEPIARTLMNGK